VEVEMNHKQQRIITFLSLAVIVLLFLISRRLWTRFDLSANNANTLSEVSRNLRNEIEDTVRITYWCTGRLSGLDPFPGEVTDLLREYASSSKGKIQLTVKDPSKGLAADAENAGIAPWTLNNLGDDELSIATVYSGIVIQYLNKAEVIPRVVNTATLEYDVTSRIRSLVSGRKRELGIITADPGKDLSDYYQLISQFLAQSGFSVLPLRAGDEIPDTLPALFVFGGVETLDEYALYRIDRYLQNGGRALFAVESVAVDVAGSLEARLAQDKGLLQMLSYYGATVGQSIVMDQSALPVQYRDFMTGQPNLALYPPWFAVQAGSRNPDNTLSAQFGGVALFWASPLTLTLPESGEVKGQELFSTTDEAWLMTKDFNVQPGMNFALTAEQGTTAGKQTLAIALEGKLPSWFNNVPKPEAEDRPALPDMPASPKESLVVVLGDSDAAGYLLQVVYQYFQSELNIDFMLQTADWLGSDDDIVGIRNRAVGQGRLDRIADRGERVGKMLFARFLNVILVPVLIIIAGIIRALRRRRNLKEQPNAA
jgi:ABC-type uncharacterized transport system involved in gliding motility auxiliary subunit